MVFNNLKQIREEKGMGQRALAERLGITVSAVWRMEKGTLKISVETALAIADILGCSLDELFGRA